MGTSVSAETRADSVFPPGAPGAWEACGQGNRIDESIARTAETALLTPTAGKKAGSNSEALAFNTEHAA